MESHAGRPRKTDEKKLLVESDVNYWLTVFQTTAWKVLLSWKRDFYLIIRRKYIYLIIERNAKNKQTQTTKTHPNEKERLHKPVATIEVLQTC